MNNCAYVSLLDAFLFVTFPAINQYQYIMHTVYMFTWKKTVWTERNSPSFDPYVICLFMTWAAYQRP